MYKKFLFNHLGFSSTVDSIPWGSLMMRREAAGNALMDTTCAGENLSLNPFTSVLSSFCPITKVLDSYLSSKNFFLFYSYCLILVGDNHGLNLDWVILLAI